LSETGTPTPTVNPYLRPTDSAFFGTTGTVNSSAEIELTNTNAFAGMERHFGVNGSVQTSTGYLTGYANRNVFNIDLVALPASGVISCYFGIKVGTLSVSSTTQGIFIDIRERSGGGAWDLLARWSLNTAFPTQQTATLLPATTNLSNFYGTYQIEFFNPVYVYNSQFFNFVRFNWNVLKDGVTLASSSSYTNLEINYNFRNLCDNTYYFAQVQDSDNADATFDNFGIGLNGNLSCLPLAPPPAPGP
jgi:hypothetical protein